MMAQEIITPSGIKLRCQEISESDNNLGCFVAFCKRYRGMQMMDYGTSRLPEADKYIDDHKQVCKEQAERSKEAKDDSEEEGRPDKNKYIAGTTSTSNEI